MVTHAVPNGQLPTKPTSPEQLKTVVKVELPSSNQGFSGGIPQWQTHGSKVQGQSPCLGRISSPNRQSLVSGQSSPKVEHQLYRERDAPYEEYAQDRKRSKIRDSSNTISSQMQSQLLAPRAITGSSGPTSTRDSPAPAPKFNEALHSGDRNTSQIAPGPRLSHAVSLNPLDEPSPLGLTLRKTPSLIDLISMKLQQGGAGDHGSVNPDALSQEAAKNRAAKCLVPTVTAQDKLKASNFPASSLKVGTWERMSRYEGDLVGKCYYAKRKLVWEVLDSGLKSKIEIQWSDISAMKASCPENLPGTLEIEVSRPPVFFRETNPQPRKHTLWQATSDFTGGQATICKRHSLQFPEGVLNRHYEKLVQCDPRLKSLVEGMPSMRPTTSDFEQTSWLFDGKHLPAHQPVGHHNSSHDGNKNQPSFIHRHMHALPGSSSVTCGETTLDPKPEVRLIKMHSNDLASPSSVMDPRGSDESGTSDTEDLRLHDDLSEYDGIDLTYPNSTTIDLHDLADAKSSCNDHYMIENVLRPEKKALDEITQVLFGDPVALSNEHQTMVLAQKMTASMVEELQLPHPGLPHGVEGSGLSDPNHVHPFSPFHVKSEQGDGDYQLDLMIGSGAMNNRLSNRDGSLNSIMTCFSKHGSAGDLLMSLPRVASLPQLFETPSPFPVGRYDSSYTRPSYFSGEKLR